MLNTDLAWDDDAGDSLLRDLSVLHTTHLDDHLRQPSPISFLRVYNQE